MGNLPAGYIISNAIDMGKWISAHLGSIKTSNELANSIQMSHVGDKTVDGNGRFFYGYGWYIHTHGKKIKHGGSNPNYSSMLLLDKQKQIGICVLSNMNSIAAQAIAENTMRIICKRNIKTTYKDNFMRLDRIFSRITIAETAIFSLLIFLALFLNPTLVYVSNATIKSIVIASLTSIFLYFINKLVLKARFKNMSMKMIYIWAPFSVIIGYCESLFIIFSICWVISNLIF